MIAKVRRSAFWSVVVFLTLVFASLTLLSQQLGRSIWVFGSRSNTPSDTAAICISSLLDYSDKFHSATGRYPNTIRELMRFQIDEAGWPQADAEFFQLDPWGNAYSFGLRDEFSEVCISSAGPDEQFGTSDDISSSTYNR